MARFDCEECDHVIRDSDSKQVYEDAKEHMKSQHLEKVRGLADDTPEQGIEWAAGVIVSVETGTFNE